MTHLALDQDSLVEMIGAGNWPHPLELDLLSQDEIDDLAPMMRSIELASNLPDAPAEARIFVTALKARLAAY